MANVWLSSSVNGFTHSVNFYFDVPTSLTAAEVSTTATKGAFTSAGPQEYSLVISGTGQHSVTVTGHNQSTPYNIDFSQSTGNVVPMFLSVWAPSNHSGNPFNILMLVNQNTSANSFNGADLTITNGTIPPGLGTLLTTHVRQYTVTPINADELVRLTWPAGAADSMAGPSNSNIGGGILDITSTIIPIEPPPTWPAEPDLPCISQSGYQMEPVQGFIQTQMQSGKIRNRKVFSKTPYRLACTFVMTDLQLTRFREFYEQIFNGAGPFFLPNVNYMGQKLTAEVKFLQPPVITLRERFKIHDVSCVFDVKNDF